MRCPISVAFQSVILLDSVVRSGHHTSRYVWQQVSFPTPRPAFCGIFFMSFVLVLSTFVPKFSNSRLEVQGSE